MRRSGEAGDEVVVRVSNTGIGIPPEHRDQIFEPFWPADQGIIRVLGGTGLGPSVVRHLARMLGGDVTVESPEEEDTVFTIRHPVEGDPAGGD